MARSFPLEEGGSAIGGLITDKSHGQSGDIANTSRRIYGRESFIEACRGTILNCARLLKITKVRPHHQNPRSECLLERSTLPGIGLVAPELPPHPKSMSSWTDPDAFPPRIGVVGQLSEAAMARNMKKVERSYRLQVHLSKDDGGAIDDFWFRECFASKSAAVRELIRRGLAKDREGHSEKLN
jgi:hypothetical protein